MSVTCIQYCCTTVLSSVLVLLLVYNSTVQYESWCHGTLQYGRCVVVLHTVLLDRVRILKIFARDDDDEAYGRYGRSPWVRAMAEADRALDRALDRRIAAAERDCARR